MKIDKKHTENLLELENVIYANTTIDNEDDSADCAHILNDLFSIKKRIFDINCRHDSKN